MTRASANVRTLVGPLVRAVRRPMVVGADAVPRRGGLLMLTSGDVAPGALLAATVPRPVVQVLDGPWPDWVGAVAAPAGAITMGSLRRRALHQVARLLASGDAVAYRVDEAAAWGWAAYLQARSGAAVQAVALIGGARPVVHAAPPLERGLLVGSGMPGVPAVSGTSAVPRLAELRANAEVLRWYVTDHLRSARARAGRT